MVIEVLDENVITQLRSSSTVDSLTQCVQELVLNSIDAKSTAIAVRVNLATFRLQIVDNGKGISRQNLEFVGQRYMTNKCHSLDDLKKRIKFYGFKGEALASISKISQRLSITSREQDCDDTFCKIIEGDNTKIDLDKPRPSFGTTVTVEGFLNNLPVRQQCIRNNELENIKKSLESLVIIHPRISISLRNDSTNKILLDSRKALDIAASFKNIHPEINENNFVLFKVSKNKTSVEALIHKDFHENKRLQYVYVNKRPIYCPEVQNLINSSFKKTPNEPRKAHPVFVIHIKCLYTDIDLNLEPSKTVVFFKKMDIVKRCIEKIIFTFLGHENIPISPKKSGRNEGKSEFGLSQIGGAVRGLGVKRKSDELEEVASPKSPKIIEETPFFEEQEEVKEALPIEIKKRSEEDVLENFDQLKENSLFTEFPENERKGKDIIMDMFIKSVQVFPEEERKSLVSSVNVEVGEFKHETSDREVKTTPKEKMVSVGVQTVKEVGDFNDITFYPRKPLTKYVSEYDFDFSKIDTLPNCDFNRKFALDLPLLDNFDQSRKLFDFQNLQKSNVFDNYIPNIHKIIPQMTIEHRQKNKTGLLPKLQSESVQKSPFFLKKNKKNILSLKHSQEKMKDILPYQMKPTQSKATSIESFRDTDVKGSSIEGSFWKSEIELTCARRNKARKNLNESTVSSYFVSKKKLSQKIQDQSKDLFTLTKPSSQKSESNITVSISEDDKQKIIDRDLQYKKEFGTDILAPTLTLSQNDWVKEVNMFGTTVYTNKKTGVKTFNSPKKDFSFEVSERFDFVPKGLSPILKDHGKVEFLSPESKENLNNAVIQSYEDELLLVKWENYIDDKDPKKFFKEIYIEKSKLTENAIPNVSRSALAKREIFENMSFTKQVFKNFEIIGQVDYKFIAVIEKTKNLILLFDQHAVHERVRLEQLTEGYKNASTKINQNIMIFLPQNELNLIKNQKSTLHSLGLIFNVFTDGINVHQVPSCIYSKFKKGVNLVSLIESLMREIVETLKSNNGILVHTPRLMQNIINSEACRGAIKFGDLLSKTECTTHLKELAKCVLPFQCAHGRPTLTPLISLKKFCHESRAKPRLYLLKYK